MSLFFKSSLLLGMILLIAACSRFGMDNTSKPTVLEPFIPTTSVTKLWNKNIGALDKHNYLRFTLALHQDYLITTDSKGSVIATDVNKGIQLWRTQLKTNVMSGVGLGEGLVVVACADANLYILDAQTGKICRQVPLANQALAVPSVAKGIILVKTVDDQVFAFDAKTGKKRWTFAVGAPQLILRFGSSPVVVGDKVVIGLASGKIVVVNLAEGTILWEQAIALPKGATDAQQMVDIDVNPVVENGIIYVATYQGNIAALQLNTGVILWQQELSSYTGIAVNDNSLFITDADSRLWLFQKADGKVQWQQDKLIYRNITAPTLTSAYVVVGDSQGYVHILSRKSGEFVARLQVASDAIVSAPVAKDNEIYVLTRGGMLAAYKIG